MMGSRWTDYGCQVMSGHDHCVDAVTHVTDVASSLSDRPGDAAGRQVPPVRKQVTNVGNRRPRDRAERGTEIRSTRDANEPLVNRDAPPPFTLPTLTGLF